MLGPRSSRRGSEQGQDVARAPLTRPCPPAPAAWGWQTPACAPDPTRHRERVMPRYTPGLQITWSHEHNALVTPETQPGRGRTQNRRRLCSFQTRMPPRCLSHSPAAVHPEDDAYAPTQSPVPLDCQPRAAPTPGSHAC